MILEVRIWNKSNKQRRRLRRIKAQQGHRDHGDSMVLRGDTHRGMKMMHTSSLIQNLSQPLQILLNPQTRFITNGIPDRRNPHKGNPSIHTPRKEHGRQIRNQTLPIVAKVQSEYMVQEFLCAVHGLGNTVDVGCANERVRDRGVEFDADVEAEGGTEVFGVVEGVEGDFVEEEVCVVVPDGDVVV